MVGADVTSVGEVLEVYKVVVFPRVQVEDLV